jgi:PAS domain-containing protein
MGKILSPQSVTLLIGGAALIGTIMILAIYLLQKSFGRSQTPDRAKPSALKVEDEAAFTLNTIKSVVTQLKTEQQNLQEALRSAERHAASSTRHVKVIAGEIEQGLIIFDPQGYISFSNARVRTMLAIDTWSRRRYAEIFKDISPVPSLIAECLEKGAEVRANVVELPVQDGDNRRIEVSILPSRNSSGGIDSVVCLFSEVTPAIPEAPPTN